jgi:hypothetical protein
LNPAHSSFKIKSNFQQKQKMKILTAYTKGLIKTGAFPRMLILIYVLNLFMALLLAIPFYILVKGTAGNSMLPHELLQEFNYTAAMEWLREAGNIPGTLIILVFCIVIVYYLLWVFISGGIIHSLNRSSFSMKSFWGDSAYNFFRFLGISVLILIVQIILAGIIFGGLSVFLKNLADTAKTENEFVKWSLGGGALFILFWLFWSAVSDYAKFYLLLNNSFNVFAAFSRAFIFAIKHFFKVYILRLLLFLTPLPIWYIYWKISGSMAGATLAGLIALFVVRQIFIIVRIWFRVWTFSSQFKMFSSYFPHEKLVNKEQIHQAKLEKKAAKKAAPESPDSNTDTDSNVLSETV